jgi:hypothetical protein
MIPARQTADLININNCPNLTYEQVELISVVFRVKAYSTLARST